MEDITEGLFYCRSFVNGITDDPKAFCKPTQVHIYTAPPPCNHRVVEYIMTYWPTDTQPVTDVEWKDWKIYRSGKTGMVIYTFNIHPKMVGRGEILTEIRRHFTDVVMRNKPILNRDDAMEILKSRNTAKPSHGKSNDDDFKRVFNVRHVDEFYLLDGKRYLANSGKLHYQGTDDIYADKSMIPEVIIPCEYGDYRELGNLALAHYLQT